MVPGYVSLVILIGLRVDQVLPAAVAVVYSAGWCLCVGVVIAIHHAEWFYPAVAHYVPEPTRWPVPLRLYEPTARMRA